MAEKHVVRTEAAPAPFQGAPYSQAIRVGDLVFVAGQVAARPGESELVGPGIEEQTEQVMKNLGAILDAAGSGFDKLVKTTVFLVDFDQFCLADPALDVGYFLAYLRPAGLWYRRAGRRAWFETAAEVFRSTYLDRLAERGESAATCAGIAGRAPVFEAALLLKIAARRANRLHSPRPGEVAAMLEEVSGLLP